MMSVLVVSETEAWPLCATATHAWPTQDTASSPLSAGSREGFEAIAHCPLEFVSMSAPSGEPSSPVPAFGLNDLAMAPTAAHVAGVGQDTPRSPVARCYTPREPPP